MPKKQLPGTIVSLVNSQTAKVEVIRQWQHPLYKKRVKRSKNYACNYDEKKMELSIGDEVVIEECRPVSKTKHFRVVSKVSHS